MVFHGISRGIRFGVWWEVAFDGVPNELVGGIPTPLKIWVGQLGWLFPTEWKNKIHVPNHQPANDTDIIWFHDGFYHSYNPIITLQGAAVLPPSYKLVYNILQPPASIDTDLSWYICHKPKLPSGKLT